jgi:hypothetical protein
MTDVCPFVRTELGPPPPLPKASVAPLGTKGGGGQHLLSWEGQGARVPNSDDWRESLALCLLCVAVTSSRATNFSIISL